VVLLAVAAAALLHPLLHLTAALVALAIAASTLGKDIYALFNH
jgi:hypothetical protein